MNFAAVLAMSVVMVAGPQIVSAVLLATGPDGRRTSVAFLTGAAAATLMAVTVFYVIAELGQASAGDRRDSDAGTVIDWIVLAFLLVLAVMVYRRRGNTDPPEWMVKLQTAAPRFALRLGFLLFLLFPTDIITTATVGASLSGRGSPWWYCLPFVALTLLLVGLPLIVLLAFGRRAQTMLPKLRDWMNRNSWIISEVIIAFFVLSTVSNLASD